jgi:hypothetical protein
LSNDPKGNPASKALVALHSPPDTPKRINSADSTGVSGSCAASTITACSAVTISVGVGLGDRSLVFVSLVVAFSSSVGRGVAVGTIGSEVMVAPTTGTNSITVRSFGGGLGSAILVLVRLVVAISSSVESGAGIVTIDLGVKVALAMGTASVTVCSASTDNSRTIKATIKISIAVNGLDFLLLSTRFST